MRKLKLSLKRKLNKKRLVSTQSASTEAVNALECWQEKNKEREYDILVDEEEYLSVGISFCAADNNSLYDLSNSCQEQAITSNIEA